MTGMDLNFRLKRRLIFSMRSTRGKCTMLYIGACVAVMQNVTEAMFTRDQMYSDPFLTGSTLFTRDLFETGLVQFHIGSPS